MSVTQKSKTVTAKALRRDKAGVTRLARARLSFGKDVTAVTRDKSRDVTGFGRDSDIPALGRSVTVTPSAEQRFAGWLAGCSAEQAEAWQQRTKKA